MLLGILLIGYAPVWALDEVRRWLVSTETAAEPGRWTSRPDPMKWMMLLLLVRGVAATFVLAASALVVREDARGAASELGASLGRACRELPAMVVTSAFCLLTLAVPVMAGMSALASAGDELGWLLLGAGPCVSVWLAAVVLPAGPILVTERLSIAASFRRAESLSRGLRARVCLTLLAAIALWSAAFVVGGLGSQAIAWLGATPGGVVFLAYGRTFELGLVSMTTLLPALVTRELRLATEGPEADALGKVFD